MCIEQNGIEFYVKHVGVTLYKSGMINNYREVFDELTFLQSIGPNEMVSGNHIKVMATQIKKLKDSVGVLVTAVDKQQNTAIKSVKSMVSCINSLLLFSESMSEVEKKLKMESVCKKLVKMLVSHMLEV